MELLQFIMTGMVTELDRPGAEIADNSTKKRRTCSVADDEGSPVPELHRKKVPLEHICLVFLWVSWLTTLVANP